MGLHGRAGIGSVAMALAVVLLLASTGLAQHSYPKLCNIYFDSLFAADLELLSRWDLLVLSKRAEDIHHDELAQLRAYNPDLTIIAHMAVGYGRDFDYPAINADLSDTLAANDWWMLDTAGERVVFGTGNIMMNMSLDCPTNARGQRLCDWLPGYIHARLYQGGRWDGLFLDYSVDRVAWLDRYLPNPIDHDVDGQPATMEELDDSWRLGMHHCIAELRTLVGDDFLLVGNGNNTMYETCDGDTREDFPEMHGDWFDNMFDEEHGYLAFEAKYRKPTTNIINTIWSGDVLEDGSPARWGGFDREFLLGLTSTLVFGDGYFSCDGPAHTEAWWIEYYDFDLGMPISRAEAADVRTAYIPPWVGYLELVKKRRFENGIAVINPTYWPQEVALGGTYYDVHSWNGEFFASSGMRTQIEIKAQSGEMLMGTGVVPEHKIDAAWASMSRESVVIDWDDVDGATYYSVYRCKVAGDGSFGPKTLLTVTESTVHVDSGIVGADGYRYFIAPIDANRCEGRLSRAIAVSTEPGSDQSIALMVDELGGEPARHHDELTPPELPVVRETALTGVWPLPASDEATISFSADDERWGESEPTSVTVYDVAGRLVRTLQDGPLPEGVYERRWDLRNDHGVQVASGCYLVVLERGGRRDASKVLVLR